MTVIEGKTFDEERALYELRDAVVKNCTFAGEADGESALKESSGVQVEDCRFALRYPFWHTRRFSVSGCRMEETCRAGMWYAEDGTVTDCDIHGVKFLRECDRVKLERVTAVSPEFGWKCRDITLTDCAVTSEYFVLDCRNLTAERLQLQGKYSFQYLQNGVIRDSVLNTKDAFWHAKNVRVENCVVNGEYLGWYSEGLTLVNCRIRGTQPLCYCKNLTLVNCTMEDADLAFEKSEVQAEVKGHILSVKNPSAGCITADSIGEIIRQSGECIISVRA